MSGSCSGSGSGSGCSTSICFTPGTRIATPRGEVAVQDLQVGDRVITRDDGVQEILWIGKEKLENKKSYLKGGVEGDSFADWYDANLARYFGDAEATSGQGGSATTDLDSGSGGWGGIGFDGSSQSPVLIKKAALGNGLPERDMMVSPNHRMLVVDSATHLLFDEREVLVPAKLLTGRPGIQQVDALDTVYIHLLFERHEVILGDGAWTESFQPGDYSLAGIDRDQRNEITKLFPDLQRTEGRLAYAAARRSLKAHEARVLSKRMDAN